MGTYTANYQLYMPSIGEQGWGELINENYQTIDTTMKSFSNRIGTLETETDAVAQRVGTLEGKVSTIENEVNGNLVCNSVTADGFNGKWNVNPVTTGKLQIGDINYSYPTSSESVNFPLNNNNYTNTYNEVLSLNENFVNYAPNTINFVSRPIMGNYTFSLTIQVGGLNGFMEGSCNITITLPDGTTKTKTITVAGLYNNDLGYAESHTFEYTNVSTIPENIDVSLEVTCTRVSGSYPFIKYQISVTTITDKLYLP